MHSRAAESQRDSDSVDAIERDRGIAASYAMIALAGHSSATAVCKLGTTTVQRLSEIMICVSDSAIQCTRVASSHRVHVFRCDSCDPFLRADILSLHRLHANRLHANRFSQLFLIFTVRCAHVFRSDATRSVSSDLITAR